MTDNKDKLKQLISQGETLLNKIPKKSDWKLKEKSIRDNYRKSDPLASIGREYVSNGLGELASSIFGTKKRVGKSATSKTIRNIRMDQRDNLVKQVWVDYDSANRDCEQNYINWRSKVEQTLKSYKYPPGLKKYRDSKSKVKLETKVKWGIDALTRTLNHFETKSQNKIETQLIKTGEPLKGRNVLIDFIKKSKSYVKIQEPYPSSEILELIEEAQINIRIKLLLGPFNTAKDKEKFEKHLALLRRTGRDIEVLSIKCQNTAPFHDRFIITKNKAISTGTSLSGLGFRDSIVNDISDHRDIEKRFNEYMIGPKTKHRGKDCNRERL